MNEATDSAWASSYSATVVARLRTALDESRAGHAVAVLAGDGAGFARAAADDARSTEAIRQLDRWSKRSSLSRIMASTAGWMRASFCYRWLTAEPEPEAIVVDLRETVTVAPLIAALDRTVSAVGPGLETATVADVAEALAAAIRAAPVRAVSLVVLVAVLGNLAWIVVAGELTTAGFLGRVSLVALAALGTRVDVPWNLLSESWPVQLAIAALEPPEPPDRTE